MPSGQAEHGGVDIVLGDRYGASAGAEVVETLESSLRLAGFRVRRNKPYAGGFITEHYGAPSDGVHAVQIEIARPLYMDERRIAKLPGWERLRDDLFHAAEAVAERIGGLAVRPMAAE